LIEKKIKKTAVFSSERKTISQSHMRVGKEDERGKKKKNEKNFCRCFLSCLEE